VRDLHVAGLREDGLPVPEPTAEPPLPEKNRDWALEHNYNLYFQKYNVLSSPLRKKLFISSGI
jgi:hypothetical protein